MSRSYKYPVFKDTQTFYKQLSNKRIRRYLKSLSKGFKSSKLFKRLVNPYDICDWKWFPTEQKQINKSKRK